MFVLSSSREFDDIITKLNLRQSAFCIEIFEADIQIPETSLQALFPFSPLLRPHTWEGLLAGYSIPVLHLPKHSVNFGW